MIKSFFKKRIFFYFVVVAILIAGIFLKISSALPKGGDFSLIHKGRDWRFSENPKKLNILYFGFTKCADVCPLTLSHSGRAFFELSEKELNLVRLIFVSVDSEHDSSEEVDLFAKNFFPDFIGLTGDQQEIDDAISSFPAGYIIEDNPDSHMGYSITHTDKLLFLNHEGYVMESLSGPRDSKKVLEMIRSYLKKVADTDANK